MNKIIQIAAYRLDPNLRSKSDAQQSIAFVETAGIIWFLPFALGGLVWLVMATDIVVIRQAWPLLLLLLLAHHLFARLDFTFRRPTGGGLYTIVGGSFVNFVTWSAVLILGPVVLWLALLHELGRIFQRWWRSGGYRQQIHNNLLHLNSTLVLLSFVPLAALAVYGRFDGAYPLPGLVWSDLWPAIVATIVYVVLPVLLLLPIMYLGSRQNQGWWLFFRMILFANGFVAATLPFAILAAGLYTMLGLGVYLAVLGGGFMANLLAYHFSQILNSRDERAMELTVLEELGRQIIAAPPELAALPQLLNQRGSSLTGGAPIAIWLTDMGLLYQHGQQQPFDTESATAVLQQVLAANPDCNHLLQEEKGGTLRPC